MEFVPGAVSLPSLGAVRCAAAFDPTTDGGRRRLRELGGVVALDALIDNSDRLPVLWPNRGNARNVLLSENATGANASVIALDQLARCAAAQSGARGAELRASYLARLERWLLCVCDESVDAASHGAHAEATRACVDVGGSPLAFPLRAKCIVLAEELGVDAEVACAALQATACANGDSDIARSISSQPHVRAYVRRRGAQRGACHPLLAVRDQVATVGGYDFGLDGLACVVAGVRSTARRIATALDDAALVAIVREMLEGGEVDSAAGAEGAEGGGEGTHRAATKRRVTVDARVASLRQTRDIFRRCCAVEGVGSRVTAVL